MFVLCVTFLVEIPVLLMVAGGSNRLCSLTGKRRYELMMGFLPLSSAISGNACLQSSMLTTRAISHAHVTLQSFPQWLTHEIGAAVILGLGIGSMLGVVACVASGGDFAFGVAMMLAQLVSVVTAGCTGAVSPLLFSLIFRRDSDKWVAPLGTAIQDVVGSFSMVILSYWILVVLGPRQVDSLDVCGLPEAAG
jgi:Mg/Co/Ni transporter MgtE